jgi:hypothetical protein
MPQAIIRYRVDQELFIARRVPDRKSTPLARLEVSFRTVKPLFGLHARDIARLALIYPGLTVTFHGPNLTKCAIVGEWIDYGYKR